jgi:hypothetical protein
MFPLARPAVAIAVAILGLFAASAGYGQTHYPTVKSGRWHDIAWKFTARTGSDGSYCLQMTIRGRTDSRGCGSIRDRASRGISYLFGTGRPAPAYVVGPVIAKARFVQIKFFDRPPIRISTIAPPRTLYRGIRFFAAILPCPATPRSFVARNAARQIVAQIIRARRGVPKTSC